MSKGYTYNDILRSVYYNVNLKKIKCLQGDIRF